jgi:hypothetical protein
MPVSSLDAMTALTPLNANRRHYDQIGDAPQAPEPQAIM